MSVQPNLYHTDDIVASNGDADEYDPSSSGSTSIYEQITPSSELQHSLLAITTAAPTDRSDPHSISQCVLTPI
jgi:hypothetical protein